MSLTKRYTPEPLPLLFSFPQNLSPPHVSLFLTEINTPLFGQISYETWYTWRCLALTIYPDDPFFPTRLYPSIALGTSSMLYPVSVQSVEAKYGIIFKRIFCLISQIFEKKKRDKSKFSWLALLFKHYSKLKFTLKIIEWEKKRQRIYDLLNAETKPKFLCLHIQREEITEKELFKEKE